MIVVSTTKMSNKHVQRLNEQFPECEFIHTANTEEARAALAKAEVFVTFGRDVTSELVGEAPALKWVHVMSAGLDPLPFDALKARGIAVTNVRGIHAIPMAEYTFAVLLQIVRQVDALTEAQRAQRWDQSVRFAELWDKTLGIVGVGAIGQEIARRAKVFGMHTLGVNTSGRAVPHVDTMFLTDELAQLMSASDYVVVTVPYLPETHHLIDAKALAAMRREAYLINISRGSVVDEHALMAALEQQEIGGAVLDVFVQEPLPTTHPLWTMDNVILTPHIAALSPMYMTRAVHILVHNMTCYLQGDCSHMQNVVDLDKRY
ncbi:D-2-hydroxyacid dehydrogenase [Numidum massiliense]|uniref:D-2-hydroxyacid dehydrogenase n=1 Tax=Numidum massiliense TaxID=1522315 RepID=UPI0006D53A57|nr:D-2-hydroxyacid dehydrogenase [Numidum massiliense]